MCKLLEEGDLGFKDMRKFYEARLATWKWHFMSEEQGKWKDIVVSKYGADPAGRQSSLKYQLWWWRDLCKACGDGVEEGWFKEALVWKVGSGDKLRFWEDIWRATSILLPCILYSLSLDQGLTVDEVGEWVNSTWKCRLRWRRARFEWESVQEEEMLRHISTDNLKREVTDLQVWGGDVLGKYYVKSVYERHANHLTEVHRGIFSQLWHVKALLNRIPT